MSQACPYCGYEMSPRAVPTIVNCPRCRGLFRLAGRLAKPASAKRPHVAGWVYGVLTILLYHLHNLG